MPHSLVKIYIHIVFSTKDRNPFLADPALRNATHAYMARICKTLGSPALIIGGVADHVHILLNLSRTVALRDLIHKIKRDSSIWIKKAYPEMAHFYWQRGYSAFSVKPRQTNKLYDYIANQEEHHRTLSFKDEFVAILKRYDMPFDETYLWD